MKGSSSATGSSPSVLSLKNSRVFQSHAHFAFAIALAGLGVDLVAIHRSAPAASRRSLAVFFEEAPWATVYHVGDEHLVRIDPASIPHESSFIIYGKGWQEGCAVVAVMRKLLLLANVLLEQDRCWLPERGSEPFIAA